ncbi:DNA mismatch repair protein Msh5 [Spraguea lophii 42_110]|uniref:DNA mismatch repair protein Msh5 n=1 Tax=Spraguea lophii (strain 42_110) TaxID=1358809 RepID=S7XPN0_SPRLO|nr:DNA mismatch repair protein Msh5 [Spraguea lophii 42_110]
MNNEEMIIMSLEIKKTYVGICIYETETKEFLLCRNEYENLCCDFLRSIIIKLGVDVCLISPDLDVEKYDFLDNTGTKIKFASREKLFKGVITKIRKYFCIIDYELSIYALVSMLNYLKKNLEYFEIEELFVEEYNKLSITEVKNKIELKERVLRMGRFIVSKFNVREHVYINYETVNALQLIHKYQHPNQHINTKKEMYSIFSHINKTETTYGCNLLKSWLLFPLINKENIKERHKAI